MAQAGPASGSWRYKSQSKSQLAGRYSVVPNSSKPSTKDGNASVSAGSPKVTPQDSKPAELSEQSIQARIAAEVDRCVAARLVELESRVKNENQTYRDQLEILSHKVDTMWTMLSGCAKLFQNAEKELVASSGGGLSQAKKEDEPKEAQVALSPLVLPSVTVTGHPSDSKEVAVLQSPKKLSEVSPSIPVETIKNESQLAPSPSPSPSPALSASKIVNSSTKANDDKPTKGGESEANNVPSPKKEVAPAQNDRKEAVSSALNWFLERTNGSPWSINDIVMLPWDQLIDACVAAGWEGRAAAYTLIGICLSAPNGKANDMSLSRIRSLPNFQTLESSSADLADSDELEPYEVASLYIVSVKHRETIVKTFPDWDVPSLVSFLQAVFSIRADSLIPLDNADMDAQLRDAICKLPFDTVLSLLSTIMVESRVHPCIRVFRECNRVVDCAFRLQPWDRCLRCLKGKLHRPCRECFIKDPASFQLWLGSFCNSALSLNIVNLSDSKVTSQSLSKITDATKKYCSDMTLWKTLESTFRNISDRILSPGKPSSINVGDSARADGPSPELVEVIFSILKERKTSITFSDLGTQIIHTKSKGFYQSNLFLGTVHRKLADIIPVIPGVCVGENDRLDPICWLESEAKPTKPAAVVTASASTSANASGDPVTSFVDAYLNGRSFLMGDVEVSAKTPSLDQVVACCCNVRRAPVAACVLSTCLLNLMDTEWEREFKKLRGCTQFPLLEKLLDSVTWSSLRAHEVAAVYSITKRHRESIISSVGASRAVEGILQFFVACSDMGIVEEYALLESARLLFDRLSVEKLFQLLLHTLNDLDTHPCYRVYGLCTFGEGCCYLEEPRGACVDCMKQKKAHHPTDECFFGTVSFRLRCIETCCSVLKKRLHAHPDPKTVPHLPADIPKALSKCKDVSVKQKAQYVIDLVRKITPVRASPAPAVVSTQVVASQSSPTGPKTSTSPTQTLSSTSVTPASPSVSSQPVSVPVPAATASPTSPVPAVPQTTSGSQPESAELTASPVTRETGSPHSTSSPVAPSGSKDTVQSSSPTSGSISISPDKSVAASPRPTPAAIGPPTKPTPTSSTHSPAAPLTPIRPANSSPDFAGNDDSSDKSWNPITAPAPSGLDALATFLQGGALSNIQDSPKPGKLAELIYSNQNESSEFEQSPKRPPVEKKPVDGLDMVVQGKEASLFAAELGKVFGQLTSAASPIADAKERPLSFEGGL